jgi:hypothetical protein
MRGSRLVGDGVGEGGVVAQPHPDNDARRADEALLMPRSAEAAEGAAEGIAGAFAPDGATQDLTHPAEHNSPASALRHDGFSYSSGI